ncbi:hypothetical protein CK203_056871 [Vitis vinifera]|uniref:Agglutinin domain-containing protein n=1 Tax=Vitis vinifera TaxID=29760 RepID=A0A438GW74_VITVI|nr:hypothetical protein CK203_056871 [Vitis vinifera]
MKMCRFMDFSNSLEGGCDPYSKYQVERAKNGKGLVHIRCCYKQQILDGNAQTLRFLHVQLGHYACLWRLPPPYGSCLFAGSASPNKDLCDGDNGNYLSARTIEGHPYLEFASSDIGDPTVGNEVFTTHDGSVRIKSHHFGRFWRRSPNWIWADSDDSTTNNSDTLFWPVRVDKNVVALRNFGNNNFCMRLTTEGKTSCLNAGVSTISREARLEVAELVLSRNIYNVNFRLMDARIYDQRVIIMTTGEAINMTMNRTLNSGVPFIADGKLEISSEFSGTYEWGGTESVTTAMETLYNVTVPAMTRVTVSMIATQGSCDVPFSYSQRDTLTDGKNVIYNMDDGVYNGVNCFNVKYQTKEEKL